MLDSVFHLSVQQITLQVHDFSKGHWRGRRIDSDSFVVFARKRSLTLLTILLNVLNILNTLTNITLP